MKGIKIEQNKEMSKGQVMIYSKPKYIYIPLIVGGSADITVLVKKGDYVCKGQIVARRKGPLTIPLLSSVSGTVIEFEEKLHHTGKMIKSIKIENDFKERVEEKVETKKDISQYTKEEFLERIHDSGIVGLGGAGFPTYIKYQTNNPIKTLIVNAVECEPYITTDYTVGVNHAEEILETIDSIMEIFNIEEALIGIKKNNIQLIEALNTCIGTYVHIKLITVPNHYPMGWEKLLVQTLTHQTYDKLPIEKGIIVNNISTIYAIYQALKLGNPLTDRVITVTGEMVKHPSNILVKIGTPICEIIEAIGGLKRAKEILLIAGGPMMGNTLQSDEWVLTPDVTGIVVLRKQEPTIEQTCIRCGKCVNVCPAHIEPVLIKDMCEEKEAIKKLEVNRCIECGLCSYICPAKIKVREYVKKAKQTLKEEK